MRAAILLLALTSSAIAADDPNVTRGPAPPGMPMVYTPEKMLNPNRATMVCVRNSVKAAAPVDYVCYGPDVVAVIIAKQHPEYLRHEAERLSPTPLPLVDKSRKLGI